MDQQFPIYTATAECQDCYKCVRHCPVKAIRVEEGRAAVLPEQCVACGGCVRVCPSRAKKVRDDLSRARSLVRTRPLLVASVAPSWVAEFPGVEERKLVAALRRLGFAAVSETALGAQEVSAATAEVVGGGGAGLHISSACPSAVQYVRKYLPQHAEAVLELHSPLLAHCRQLRRHFGVATEVIFFGPCIAKKLEADGHPELLRLALTFADLREWLALEGVELDVLAAGEADRFEPSASEEGAFYPLVGGMARSMRAYSEMESVRSINISGLDSLERSLGEVEPEEITDNVFAECLACEGGCINGPGMTRRGAGLRGELDVMNYAGAREGRPRRREWGESLRGPVFKERPVVAVAETPDLREALARVGKHGPEDELNCGGCGYESCREFATAMLAGKAEPPMCVSYLRRQAQRKANALLRCMPSAVAICDARLSIVECNAQFARLFGAEAEATEPHPDSLQGRGLEEYLEFTDLFRAALESGRDIHREMLHHQDRLLNVTIFTIDTAQTVGAVIEDVTQTELRREQIARRAREVIDKNLRTVQEIACRLGENMADTEILLRSIADDYAIEPEDEEERV